MAVQCSCDDECQCSTKFPQYLGKTPYLWTRSARHDDERLLQITSRSRLRRDLQFSPSTLSIHSLPAQTPLPLKYTIECFDNEIICRLMFHKCTFKVLISTGDF